MRPLLALVVLILAAGTTLPWWNGMRGVPPGTPRLAVGGFVTLDPTQASSLEEFRLLDALCEPLVRLDPQTLRVQPALAESWAANADATRWTFRLRAARWSDGSPVTAAQMVAGLQRHRDGSASGALLDGIAALDAPDERTLVVSCSRPAATLAQVLATPVFIPLHPAMTTGTAWADPRRIIGNGPLRCSDIAPRHHLDLVPSATFTGPPAHGALRLLIVDDAGTAVRLFLDHRVDAVLRLNTDTIGDLRRTGSTELQVTPSWGTELYRLRVGPQTGRPELTAAVRRALARSIDREALVAELLHGIGSPATTLVPASATQLGYRPPLRTLAFDLPTARQELSNAGDIPVLELLVPSNQPERLRLGEWLCDRWLRDLGITVHVVGVPANLAHAQIKSHDYDLARGSLVGDYLDPAYFLACFRSGSGMNRTGFSDPLYDDLLTAAEHAPAQRLALLAEAETRLLEAAPIIPLYHYACAFLVAPYIDGVRANLLEQVRYADVRMK